ALAHREALVGTPRQYPVLESGCLPFLLIYVKQAFAERVNCVIELNMALDAVDDIYKGCRDAVLKKVLESGLREELDASPEFKAAWTKDQAEKKCIPVVHPGGVREHSQALLAFAQGGKAFRNTFNHAVRTMGGNHSFPFQSLHFLLMDSMALLQNERKVCRTMYSISSQKYSAQRGATVRLGKFTMAFLDESFLMEDPAVENGVLFNITSCFALDLTKNTCTDMDFLLLPTEAYTVEDVVSMDDLDTFSHTRISLKHATAQEGSSSTVLGCMWGVYLTVAVLGLLN
ncbi:hypothetical protein CRUP_017181, partial [Coryphaenoides rupestris]